MADIYIDIVPLVTVSNSNVTITSTALGGRTPKAAILLGGHYGNGSTVDAPDARAVLGWAVNGGNQESYSSWTQTNPGPAETLAKCESGTVIYQSPSTGDGSPIKLTLNTWITNGVTINCDIFTASGLVMYVMLIAGSDVSAYANHLNPSGSNPVTVTVSSVGFQPDIVLFSSVGSVTTQNVTESFFAGQVFGASTSAKNYCLGMYELSDFFNSGRPYNQAFLNSACFFSGDAASSTVRYSAVANNFTSSGFDFVTSGSINPNAEFVGYLCLKFTGGGAVDIAPFDTPTSTGITQVVSGLGFTPGAALLGSSGLTAVGSAYDTDPSCVLGYGMIAISEQGANSWRINRNVNRTDAGHATLPHSVIVGTKTDVLGATIADWDSWPSDGLSLNYTAVSGSATKNFAVLFYNAASLIPSNVRLPYIQADVVVSGSPAVRSPYVLAEPIVGGTPEVRMPYLYGEAVRGGNPEVRVPLIFVEVFHSFTPEGPVATQPIPLPGPINTPGRISPSAGGQAPLLGLEWNIKKTPMFQTSVESAITLKEIRVSFTPYPVYKFECAFEFLDDREGKKQLEQLMGFYMQMQGRAFEWLYQDPTDYLLEGQDIGTGDGAKTGFNILRTMGGYTEPVNQVDRLALFTFASTAVDTGTDAVNVPAHGMATGYGPVAFANPGALPTGITALVNYWIISVDADHFKVATSKANALAGTAVNITAQGSGTNTAYDWLAVYDNGTLLVEGTDYNFNGPNAIIFVTAPANTHHITVDCKFYFVCRFEEDTEEFNQFYQDLWEVQSMTFRSTIPRILT